MSNKLKLTLLLALSLAAVLCISPLSVYGDDWDKATKITVSHPFEVPGLILPAGTYMFKIVDLRGERHAVRISNENETATYATLLALADWRLETTDNTVVTFYEAENGRVPALHRWFYPGHQGGVEFAYPEKPPMEFAALAEEPAVPTAPLEPPPVFREKPKPEPVVEAIPEVPIEVEPAVEPVTPTVEPAPEPEPEPEPVPLPKTGTPFPLIGLIGLLSAVTASGLRLIRK
jgi:hypothetical protein